MHTSFKQFLIEEEKTVYFTFGRMNPPTIGHGKLMDTLASKSGKMPYRVFVSQSQDPKKNPLSYQDKIKYARKMFPRHARSIILNKKIKNVMEAASMLHDEGFINVVLVVGSDRLSEFNALLSKYNGKEGRHGFYNFKSIKVISAGDRDPDAEGVEGMSASKMRSAAADNDFTTFAQGLPKTVANNEAKRMFNAVRKAMGLKEQKEFKNHVQLAPVSDLRESYVQDKNLFQLGEQVVINKNGVVGKIKHLGTNYLIVESKGETWRCWLDDVDKVEPRQIQYDIAKPTVTPEEGITESWVCGQCNSEPCVCESINEARVRWKRGKYPGEIEATIKGKKYKIEKALDHNDRHRGEWKVMVWDKGDWEWETTEYGKANAKDWIYDKHGIEESCQPEWGTPASTKKAKKVTPGEVDEFSMSFKSITKSGINKKGLPNKDNLKKDLERLKKGLKKEATSSPQDPDIKDRKGTQPKAYHAGLSKKTKVSRDKHFKKHAKMDDDNPKAYKKAPGDATAKTKPSKHTLRFKQMYGED